MKIEEIIEEIKERWNSKADGGNQYSSLGLDEIEELFAREIYDLRFENDELKKEIEFLDMEFASLMESMEDM